MKYLLAALVNLAAVCNIFAQSDPNAIRIDEAIHELINNSASNPTNHSPASFVNFSSKEDTKGSRYLLNRWANGSVTGTNGASIQSDKVLFNYDKISNTLYVTTDMKTMMELDQDQVQSFMLKTSNGDSMMFMKMEQIHPKYFFQLIAGMGKKYTLYKYTRTKFEKANHYTDGLVETGKNYDEFIDTDEYYLGTGDDKTFTKVEINRKSLAKAINRDQVKAYFSLHADEDVNDSFLKGLIEFVNQ